MKNDRKKSESRDDIECSLCRSGVFSPYLDRMRQVSSEMNQLEWKMVRRAAAAMSGSARNFPPGGLSSPFTESIPVLNQFPTTTLIGSDVRLSIDTVIGRSLPTGVDSGT